MTKPISRKMAVQALLYRFITGPVVALHSVTQHKDVYHLICPICEGIIFPEHDIEFDHIHADVLGGPHEFQNLRPLHKKCHKKKTAKDIAAKAKIDRITGKTKGQRKVKIKSRGFDKRHRPMRGRNARH